MNADEFRRFYAIVDRAEDVQHALMLRLLFFTMVRVSELCNMQVADVKRLRELEQENGRLKRLLAERDLEVDVMKEVLAKKL